MADYEILQERLRGAPKTWLITGVAGFIGSNLLEKLLGLGQKVIGIDNFATGHQKNLDEVKSSLSEELWSNFHFIHGDICELEDCERACSGVDYVLHQAALGSVPRSIANPINTNRSNVDGFLNMLVAARDANVERFVYAASSSTYGDHPALPKVEENIGNPLSPYAVTKYVNELYAKVFNRTYGLEIVGLRYFNVFGRRQDPNGAYAAVIPKWAAKMVNGDTIKINGDGETSRDFCYIENVVQANLLAATSQTLGDVKELVINVAVGQRTTLNTLSELIHSELNKLIPDLSELKIEYRDFRDGDVRHSLADISKAKQFIDYSPTHNLQQGLAQAMKWYSASNTSS